MSAGEAKSDEVWTVSRVVRWAAQDFGTRGIETPRLDAELLLGTVLGFDRVQLILEGERPLAPEELTRYRELIKRRRAGEPVAYLIGQREFYGLSFRVDRRVLVPRPDTEVLVDAALELTHARSMYGVMLDLCTGSGCVAIAFARHRPTWRVTATDRETGALEVARENALRLGAIHNTAFAAGDLFDAVGATGGYDLITANPPYIPDAEVPTLDATVRDFEPRTALAGGADGLQIVARIVRDAPSRLAPGGVLAIEIGCDQGDRVRTLFERAGFRGVGLRRDYGGRDRVVHGHWDRSG